MRKLLVVVSALSLVASTSATVVACGQTQKEKKDYSHYNNSLVNLKGASSVIAKQLIMSDQYGISFRDLNQAVGDIKAEIEVKQNTGLNFDSNDFNLKDNSDISDLTSQYFGNPRLDNIKKTDNVNLNGTLGAKNDQLWKMLKDKLGVDLGSDMVGVIDKILGKIIPNLTGFSLFEQISKSSTLIDEKISDLIKGKNQMLINVISMVLKGIFTNSSLMEKWSKKIESFDVCAIYPDMKAESFLGAGFISLSNSLGLILANTSQETYQQTTLGVEDSKNPEKVRENLLAATKNFGKIFANFIKKDASQTEILNQNTFNLDSLFLTPNNNLEKNVDKYLAIATGFFQFLQLFQLQFSLFDDAKNYIASESNKDNYLFSDSKTNKQYIKEMTMGSDGKGRTIRQLKNVNDKKEVEGALNLKYLLSIFKSAFGPTANPEEKNGYQLEKFLNILLISPFDYDSSDEEFDPKTISPTIVMAVEILKMVIGNYLPDKFKQMVIDGLEQPLLKYLTSTFELLLSGKNIKEAILDIFKSEAIWTLITIVENLLDDNDDTKTILSWILSAKKSFNDILAKFLDLIPIFNPKISSWNELYSGDPLTTSHLKGIDRKIMDGLLGFLKKFLGDNIFGSNFLPRNQSLNLKNILNTRFSQIGGKEKMPPNFGGHYFDRSFIEIINEISENFGITGQEKLAEVSKFDFKFSHLKKVLSMIKEYKYSEVPEGYSGQNLISIILENPGKTTAILGLKEDGTIGKGSLFDLIFNDILQIGTSDPNPSYDDPLNLFFSLITSIYTNLNTPDFNYADIFKKFFNRKEDFSFNYLEEKNNAAEILGQSLVVNYHNPETKTDWKYTFEYSRPKIGDVFVINSMIKQKVLKKNNVHQE